jgi:hypothetical protein
MKIYLLLWLLFCGCCATLWIRDKAAFSFAHRTYRQFLCVRWKIVTFSVAASGIVIVAPYTGDPTWDYFDALIMAVLTFLTAPWSVGTLYRTMRGKAGQLQAAMAACLWMLSASWCYDLYLLLRDGAYPVTWASNIAASSVLYLCAGLFWNLEWRPGKGVIFSFMEDDWPGPGNGQFGKIALFGLPFMLIAAAAIVYFLL